MSEHHVSEGAAMIASDLWKAMQADGLDCGSLRASLHEPTQPLGAGHQEGLGCILASYIPQREATFCDTSHIDNEAEMSKQARTSSNPEWR
jgi:hypothetical protein